MSGGRPETPRSVIPFKADSEADERVIERHNETARKRAKSMKPPGMSAEASKVWDREAPLLAHPTINRLARHHADQFALYCEALARYNRLRRLLSRRGVGESYSPGKGRNGEVLRTRPEVAQMNIAFDQAVKLGAYFGKTPYTERHIQDTPQRDLFDDPEDGKGPENEAERDFA